MKSRRRNNIPPPPSPSSPKKPRLIDVQNRVFHLRVAPKREKSSGIFSHGQIILLWFSFCLCIVHSLSNNKTGAAARLCSLKLVIFFNGLKFFNIKLKWADLQFFKKRLQHRCFPKNIAKILITTFFTEHLWWLLLTKPCLVVLIFKSTEYTLCHS